MTSKLERNFIRHQADTGIHRLGAGRGRKDGEAGVGPRSDGRDVTFALYGQIPEAKQNNVKEVTKGVKMRIRLRRWSSSSRVVCDWENAWMSSWWI